MKIKEMLQGVDIVKSDIIDEEQDIINITDYSKEINEGFAFIANAGYDFDGNDFIEEAEKLGAKLIVCENEEKYNTVKTNKVLVKEGRKAKAIIAKNFYLDPQKELTLIGVTGTKGKTTTTFMIKNILDKANIPTGVIGTIAIMIGDKTIMKSVNTTPDSIELQRTLRIMVNEGIRYVIMEVSSQALKLDRVYGFTFDYAIFTNIYKEHLSKKEHANMKEYLQAKLKLFENAKFGVINEDDFAREYFKKLTPEHLTYGIANKSDFNATDINIRSTGVDFITIIDKKAVRINTKIPGRYTVYNALAAIAVTNKIGIKAEVIREGIKEVVVPGRFEVVENERDIPVIIDFAGVPESLESILKAARLYTTGRVVSVFGCEGEKNIELRKEMGKVSGKNADMTVVTTFNPRGEKPEEIAKEVIKGIREVNGKAVTIIDRKEAIEFALSKAQKRDMIIITGLGHNKEMEIAGEKVPFDERKIIKEYLKNN